MKVKMSKSEFESLSYVDAGVDVGAAELTVKAYSEIAMKTMRPEVLSGVCLLYTSPSPRDRG